MAWSMMSRGLARYPSSCLGDEAAHVEARGRPIGFGGGFCLKRSGLPAR